MFALLAALTLSAPTADARPQICTLGWEDFIPETQPASLYGERYPVEGAKGWTWGSVASLNIYQNGAGVVGSVRADDQGNEWLSGTVTAVQPLGLSTDCADLTQYSRFFLQVFTVDSPAGFYVIAR